MLGHFFSIAIKHYIRAPLITAVNILGLALGLACFLAAWGMSSYWSQSDSHFAKSDRIRLLTQQFQAEGRIPRDNPAVAEPAARYLKEDMPELEAIARLSGGGDSSLSYEGQSISLYGAIADRELFDIFDFDFIYGSSEEALVTRENIIITRSASERLFGDANPVGRSVVVNAEETHIIVGVIDEIPQPSHMGTQPGALRQFEYLRQWPEPGEDDFEWWLGVSNMTYLLLPEENMSDVEAKLDRTLANFAERRIPEQQIQALERIWFDTMTLSELQTKQLDNRIFQNQSNFFTVTGILFGMGLVILLVSCINYANLATAQAAGYAKEVGLRKVVGAGRESVILQYWLEALILTMIAGGLSFVFLGLASPILEARAGINLLVGLLDNPLFWPILIGLVLLTSVLASLYPVVFLSRVRPVEALRSGKIKSGNQLLTKSLVGTQFAAASVLLIILIVVAQQNQFVRNMAIQPEADPVAILVDGASSQVGSVELKEALSDVAAIQGVSHINYVPWGNYANYFGLARSRDSNAISATGTRTDVGYDFERVFDVELLAGRTYQEALEAYDHHQGFQNSTDDMPIILDETFVMALGFESAEEAIGQLLYFPEDARQTFQWDPTFRVIGVVETIPLTFGIGDVRSNVYWLNNHGGMNPSVKIDRARVQEGISAIERAITDRVPNSAVKIRFLDGEFERSFRTYQGINTGFTGLSLIALTISAMGLFAMAVFTAIQRRHEIGVRKTLGASTWEVTSLLIRDFSRPVLIANIIGWPIAWSAANTYLKGFMQRVELTPWPWVLGFVFTVLIAWVAVGGQAFSAARVKPAEVLKDE